MICCRYPSSLYINILWKLLLVFVIAYTFYDGDLLKVIMPIVDCPRPDCDYGTDDVNAVLAAALLTAHATIHNGGGGGNQSSHIRPPPMERLKLLPNCPRADWDVFAAKWRSFNAATGVADDKVEHQLLGCLDGELSSLVYNEHLSPETLREKDLMD